MEIKSFPFELKASDDGTFEGYASVFRNVDSYRDIIEPGAFSKTIAEGAKRVKVLWQHNVNIPIGVPIHMEEDNHGLFVKAKISQTTFGKDALILMRDGVVNELSIGFNTVKDEWDSNDKVRKIKEVRLWEFSPVTFAANDQATITGVKNDAELFNALNQFNIDLKAGKVLSEKNKTLVKNAIDALKSLLEASEPGKSTHDIQEADIKDILGLIDEMKSFNSATTTDEIKEFSDFIQSLK